MAKYEVKFSCGHTQIIELFGKDKDRQRKIEYFEERGLCKDCYKSMMQEIEAHSPLGLTAQLNPLETYPFRAYFTGDTESVEDKVEALGFFWTDIGDNDILSTSEFMGWSCECKSSEELGKVFKEVKKVFPEIEIKFDFKEVDMALFKRLKEQEAQNEVEGKKQAVELQKKIDELEKPQRPDCYPEGNWNGRFYKAEKGYRRIYVNNKELLITEEDGQAIERFDKQVENYKLQVAAIKGDENAAKQLEKEAKIKELKKPEKPDCYPKGRWNERFYKAEKGYRRIYVDSKELLISEEDGQAIDDYLTALSRYEDTVAKLKEGV